MSVKVTIGNKEYFPSIDQIKYKGPDSKNMLSFKYYDENRVVGEKKCETIFALPVLNRNPMMNLQSLQLPKFCILTRISGLQRMWKRMDGLKLI
ncbi:MAG TPA: hypothetical protein DHW42_06755 [Candidatus Marinimicrobia bacterium]|nr:hypothetical protein [Candidatus Neomarinimicrobiota bacterium]